MREIKFRVWDRENLCRKMSYSEIEFFDDMMGFRFQHFDGDVEDLVFMQYTGLKDKNGKEIYEGDIIYWKDLSKASDGTLEDNVVVFWDDEHLRWSAESFSTPNECQKLYDYSDVDEIEVIGNIYENKELIGENDNE